MASFINSEVFLIIINFCSGYERILGDREKAAIEVEKIIQEVDHNYSGKVELTGL